MSFYDFWLSENLLQCVLGNILKEYGFMIKQNAML